MVTEDVSRSFGMNEAGERFEQHSEAILFGVV
jgi:hypothetical protein